MVEVAAEVMLGMTRDPLMGPVLTIGAGGTDVEQIADVSCLLPPVTPDEVADCLGRLQNRRAAARPGDRRACPAGPARPGGRILPGDGAGQPAGQVDLNPVVLTTAGEVKIVDAVVAIAADSQASLACTEDR